ncbi:hypothetical protein RBSWK_05985 [Rhodopirellula baltica SWK14]|uniref:Uncharacterized protein n=1 Tax=Rhodopirellula baltica SWK14 TaxID=993516 RepID=L7C7A6_RHOBT|nr:hypothetical protein RBSWK_05985 [Rhodopirellula baltica SWK14]
MAKPGAGSAGIVLETTRVSTALGIMMDAGAAVAWTAVASSSAAGGSCSRKTTSQDESPP